MNAVGVDRELSEGRTPLRVLLGLQVILLMALGAFVAWVNAGFAALATDAPDEFRNAILFGIVLILACGAFGAGLFCLTFVRRWWADVLLAVVEVILLGPALLIGWGGFAVFSEGPTYPFSFACFLPAAAVALIILVLVA